MSASDERVLRDCRQCGAKPGERHDGCDIARCVSTGFQFIQCAGELHIHQGREYGEHEGPCHEDIWTGEWPGAAECREYGFWSYFNTRDEQYRTGGGPFLADHPVGWVQVEPDDEYLMQWATEDLNRLMVECVWDRGLQKFVPRAPGGSI